MSSSGEGSPADRLWWYRGADAPVPVRAVRPRWIRREGTIDFIACLAVATLCFSQACRETLFRTDWGFYNRTPLGAPTLVALILSIVALAAVGWLAVRMIRRRRRPAWRRPAAALAAATFLVALNFVRLTYETLGRWTDVVGAPALLGLVGLTLAVSLAWPGPALRVMRGLALTAAPLAGATLVIAVWMFLEVAAGPTWRRGEPAPLKGTAPSLRRVVWLVLEELDQRLTFEARPAGLELPELDRLRRESLYAGAARPPAGVTAIAMPALITGRPVVAVAPTSPNDLELTFADGKTARWLEHPNVFSRARVLGYDTALIGWQLPYPRVVGGSLGFADWRPSVAAEQARGDTLAQAIANQWASLVPPVNARRLRAQRFAELRDLALRTATDDRFGLVLLHLPIPQPPGIYDRATGRLTPWSFTGEAEGYLDNLVLADQLVGELRRRIERTRMGDRTWIVMSSTHWWRASKQYDGQVDHRVPFLVRPPDGGRARHLDVAFNTLNAHDLVLAILRGGIQDTGDAATWLTRQPAAPPKDYTSQGRPIY
jgi:hypothetical protein